MNRIISLISSFCLISLSLSGQEVIEKAKITWGKEMQGGLREILFYDETGMCVWNTIPHGVIITQLSDSLELYDNQLQKIRSVPLELKYGDKEMKIEFVSVSDSKILVFYSILDQNPRRIIINIQKIDKRTLMPDPEVIKLDEIIYTWKGIPLVYFSTSDNDSMFLIYTKLYNLVPDEQFGLRVYGSNFKRIWDKTVTLPYKENSFDVKDYRVDNDGNVHLLCVKSKEKSQRVKRMPGYDYEILSLLKDGTDMQELKIESGEKFLTDMQITLNQNQGLICWGFYSNKGISTTAGAFILKANPFTKEIIYHKPLTFSNQNIEYQKHVPRKLIMWKDGGTTLIGERFRESTIITGNKTAKLQHYNRIMVIKFSPKGDFEWLSEIYKDQTSDSDFGELYMSFNSFSVQDRCFFVFNDDYRNVAYKKEGDELFSFIPLKEHPQTITWLVEVDNKGKQKREVLFSSESGKVIPEPDSFYSISDSELIFFASKWSQTKLGKNISRIGKIALNK